MSFMPSTNPYGNLGNFSQLSSLGIKPPGFGDEEEQNQFRTPPFQPQAQPPQQAQQPIEPQKKSWRDTTFGRAVFGQPPIEPQGNTATQQYQDLLTQKPPAPGIMQGIGAFLGTLGANIGNRGQMDTSMIPQLLYGNYNQQLANYGEAAKQEQNEGRVQALLDAAQARAASADAQYQRSQMQHEAKMAEIEARQQEKDNLNQRMLEAYSASTVREWRSKGFEPIEIEETNRSDYESQGMQTTQLPNGKWIAVRKMQPIIQEQTDAKIAVQAPALESKEKIAAGNQQAGLARAGIQAGASTNAAEIRANAARDVADKNAASRQAVANSKQSKVAGLAGVFGVDPSKITMPGSEENGPPFKVTAPNGKTYEFPTKAAADSFRAKAGIQ